MNEYKDFTIKAKTDNPEAIEKLLIQMNANFLGLDMQIDYYFETEKGKLKYRQGTIENLITHYEREFRGGIEKTTVFRYDKNPTPEQITRLKTEKKQIGVTEKERKIYWLNNIKIHLDRLPGGQCFIEIEAIDRENNFTDEELKSQLLAVKSMLHIQDHNLVKTGYMS